MSFGSSCQACSVEFSSRGVRGFFAQPGLAARPSYLRMFRDIARFYRDARAVLDGPAPSRLTLGTYLDDRGFGRAFRDHFLVPITAAVWSTAPGRTLDYPLDYLLRFLDNHGLIGVGRALQWRAVAGGSRTYVDRLVEALRPGTVRSGDPVVGGLGATRPADRPDRRGRPRARSTRSCMATHADDALRALVDADAAERPPSAAFDYTATRSSSTPMPGSCRDGRPPGRRGTCDQDCCDPAGAADHDLPHEPAAIAAGPVDYFVSVNPGDRVRDERVIAAREFDHPLYTFRTLDAQAAHRRLQGHRETWYAGAHLGYGFHEDGCRSGYEAAALIGAAALELAA